jgi:hypothetical protein
VLVLDRKLLSIYLNDHLLGATAGRELARRAAGANEGNEYGEFLARLAQEIEADRRALEGLMVELGVGRDRVKVAAGWAGEKVGRLKLNGSITSYSPLSRLVELEGLVAGIQGKIALWRALMAVADEDERLDRDYLERLATRGEEQQREAEEHRVRAAREALAAKSPAPG